MSFLVLILRWKSYHHDWCGQTAADMLFSHRECPWQRGSQLNNEVSVPLRATLEAQSMGFSCFHNQPHVFTLLNLKVKPSYVFPVTIK